MYNEWKSKAKWIGSGEGWFKTGQNSPATELRREFTVSENFEKAECVICGLGFYTLHINGRRVGDDVLSPAFTDYCKTVLYMTYDLSDYLVAGKNVVAVKLGDGFYNQTAMDEWNFYTAPWRNLPRLLFELFLDGESALVSDGKWKMRTAGATVHTSVRCGEYYDARLADGWERLDYRDTGWQSALTVSPPGGKLAEMTMPPARECEVLAAVKRWRTENGWIFDFGKNSSGYAGICASAPAGTTATLRYSDIITDEGELDQSQYAHMIYSANPFATDKYTFRGEGVEEWKPEFVFHGFRYVEFIWELDEEPPLDALRAYFVHTDLQRKGDFTCSDGLMTWIHEAGVRAFLSNYQGLPTDCPHREKNGWTGDAVISADYAVCLFDMEAAYAKWLGDMHDAQRLSGQLPGIVPTGGWGYNWGAGPAWDFALFALPYVLYLETGATHSFDLARHTMARYLEYAKTREDEDGLVCYGLSDWCPPREIGDINPMDNRFSDSCYYYAMHGIMSEIYGLLGMGADSRRHLDKAHEIKAAIRKIFYTGADLDALGQGALAFLLYFRIVEGGEAEDVARRLAELVIKDGYVHKVGILGMKALPNVLFEYGYADVSYKMMTRTDYPSYGYWRALGETTLCESWEKNYNSRNHHMYADVLNWQIRHIAGLKNEGVAYDRASFKPYLFADDCSASASTETPRGRIGISWERHGDLFTADITLPEKTRATLTVGGQTIEVKTGRYEVSLSHR